MPTPSSPSATTTPGAPTSFRLDDRRRPLRLRGHRGYGWGHRDALRIGFRAPQDAADGVRRELVAMLHAARSLSSYRLPTRDSSQGAPLTADTAQSLGTHPAERWGVLLRP